MGPALGPGESVPARAGRAGSGMVGMARQAASCVDLSGFLPALLDQAAGFCAVFYVFAFNHAAQCFGGCLALLVSVPGLDVCVLGVFHWLLHVIVWNSAG